MPNVRAFLLLMLAGCAPRADYPEPPPAADGCCRCPAACCCCAVRYCNCGAGDNRCCGACDCVIVEDVDVKKGGCCK